jgi:hypothetical protein
MEAPVSTYLTRPSRTLAVVCRQLGRDDHGRACAQCLLRDLCDPGKNGGAADPLNPALSTAP